MVRYVSRKGSQLNQYLTAYFFLRGVCTRGFWQRLWQQIADFDRERLAASRWPGTGPWEA
jgi:hypothetical protein